MNAPEVSRFGYVDGLRGRLLETGWWHSFELPDGTLIEGANTLEGLRARLAPFPIPNDLRGMRALDIGTWDGWYAFELERRGAEVMAIDLFDNPKFRQMHRTYHSRVDYRQMDVYELNPASVGRFDVVLFMGVLYHLKHPLLGLERVCAVTRGLAAVDSFVLQERFADGAPLDRPMLEFFEHDEFGGQPDNWCAPNVACLLAFCRTAGFARVELRQVAEFGAAVACSRRWEEPAEPHAPACDLLQAFHQSNYGVNFDSRREDQVVCWFRYEGTPLLQDLKPAVGDLGILPSTLEAKEDGIWQAGFPLPPGLPPGWHDVTLRVGDGPASRGLPLAIDIPLQVEDLTAEDVWDGVTWERGLVTGQVAALWIGGLPRNADRGNIAARAGGLRATVEFVAGQVPGALSRQINVRLPHGVKPGIHCFEITVADVTTRSREFTFSPAIQL